MQLKIGDKIVDAEIINGVPVIKADAQEIVREDGTVDVVVRVPCLQIAGNTKEN